MTPRTWLITGASSGFGRELATQLLDRGDSVIGTVRRPDAVADLRGRYPDTFRVENLDVTDNGSAQVATALPAYEGNPAHAFEPMLDPKNGLAPGDPARMATRIIESVDVEPAPMRLVLGSQALQSTIDTLKRRIDGFEAQRELAASTDFPAGE
jgi:uncharacterized protein YbjT (DUF2867 family)